MTIGIQPVGIAMKDWCDQMATVLSQYGIRRVLQGETDWPVWSAYVYTVLQRYKAQVPDPRFFPEWRDWAQRVCGVLAG